MRQVERVYLLVRCPERNLGLIGAIDQGAGIVTQRAALIVVVIVESREDRRAPDTVLVFAGIDPVPGKSLVIDGLIGQPDGPVGEH